MSSPARNTPAVLVVEDEILIRMDVVDIIEDAGYKTYEAGTADAAVKLMERHGDIGILFTDVELPGSMDGLRLAAHIRDGWPPVVIIIASGNIGIQKTAMPEGATFLAKPYAASLISKTLHEASLKYQ
ncbi:MAG: response regulator [Rhodobacterales bacterium]|nr:response regulator [Rhodobacterales bacterium]